MIGRESAASPGPDSREVLGVVLAGGKSVRLGRDKVAEVFLGQNMLARTVNLLFRVVGQVVVSGRDPSPFGISVPWLPDAVTGKGPAGGVLTVLEAFGRPILAVSCDLPFLREKTLADLLAARDRRPAKALMTAYRRIDTGYMESLVAVYEPAGAPLLRRAIETGSNRLFSVFTEDLRHHLDYDPDDSVAARPFFNVNSPRDLALAREMERIS
ncbi:molybdenum cofactor guanylyltransferase [Desulfolutivibrio sulfoxidireducens]|uniref:molybdenum cofactor guanylyltransferase n=1 Tax=Desulfolutivibrio sulfoxidireducens TaxID=2773299 RepID=UPI001FE390A4|nr:molybdenum cofactor guanylyltransferase [Desulfolutivibrio sulfoxidireducens]